MAFDLGVWNGMSDAERLKDMLRVIEERDRLAAELESARELSSVQARVGVGQEQRILDLEAELSAARDALEQAHDVLASGKGLDRGMDTWPDRAAAALIILRAHASRAAPSADLEGEP